MKFLHVASILAVLGLSLTAFAADMPASKPADYQIGEMRMQEFKPMGYLYSGAMAHISETYEKLMPQIFAAKLTPAETVREVYMYWEGPESPNNVVQIQVGTK
ncbi:MAG TPA: hypothetical protein VIL86_17230 [Tepidisphaeraceae bacterium]|jgi:effector-binding domain-containing protein